MGKYNLSDKQKDILIEIVETYKAGKINGWGLFIQMRSVESYSKFDSYIDWGEYNCEVDDEMDIEELVANYLLDDRINRRGARQFRLTKSGIDAVENDFVIQDEDNGMTYNLLDRQKDIVKFMVDCVQNKGLVGEFSLTESLGAPPILWEINSNEQLEIASSGDLSAIENERLINKNGNIYLITKLALDAVNNDFVRPESVPSILQYIGAQIIGDVSGGNIQAVGLADNSEIEQIVNDPEIFSAKLEELSTELLNVVKAELEGKHLSEYAALVGQLQDELTKEEPDQNIFKRLLGSMSFMNDTTASIELIMKVAPYISLLLQFANQIFS